MILDEIRDIISNVYYPKYLFHVEIIENTIYLWATYLELDIITKQEMVQTTRKWKISNHAVKSEITQTALKCILTSMEHKVREHFLYKNERVYGPHFDVEALFELAKAKRLEYRK